MADTKYYVDFLFPLKLVAYILDQIFNRKDPNNPAVVDPATREWFSQPRTGDDTGIETVTTTFKLPLSVSEISLEILRAPCTVELWYQDRSNNWRPILDETRTPIRVSVSRSDVKSYYKLVQKIYPIVAKQVRFQLTRINDQAIAGQPYVLGLRNGLIRRNVYDRSQGTQYFEEEQDVLGNVISKYIKDWDAKLAVDDDPYTFWKSAPMPDPAAVANLYLDLRDDAGGPRTIDKFYLDPVYTGNHVNLYYSSDDSIGTLKLNPITIRPDEDENTQWRLGRGRWDDSTTLSPSYYRWSMSVGPLVKQPVWFGLEWTPDFDPLDGPPRDPVLIEAMAPTTGNFKPRVEYDVGSGNFKLYFDDGTDEREFTCPLDTYFVPGDPLKIVVGWRYDPDVVYISIMDRRGVEIGHLEQTVLTLPDQVSIDGQVQTSDFRGLITSMVIKREDYRNSSASFQASPTYYVDPDPVIPDPVTSTIPSTSLDNAVYAASWTTQEHGSGGASETAYEEKEWTPVWRNFVAEKGMLFLPQAINAKYWKFEFSNLTEQPYPVYESGVEVRYKTFPVSVMQQSSAGPRLYTGEGGFLGLGTFISVNGVRAVNWLNPLSILSAVGSVIGTQYQPVQVNTGSGYISETLPNQGGAITGASGSQRLEFASSYVYRREALSPYILAEDAYVTTIKAEGLQKLADFTDVPWQDIEAANPGAITHVKSTGALPVRGTDWWIYPGQQLKVPANVMRKLTDTSTVTERKLTLETRVRFNTTQIHRYEYKTLKRDAAMAYFAGVREVIPFQSTFIAGEDKPFFDFPSYSADQWTATHVKRLPTGPITTQKKVYSIENRLFERNLNDWIKDGNAWSWDGTIGRWLRGTAKLTPDGLTHTLLSNRQSVGAGEVIDVGVSMKWEGLSAMGTPDGSGDQLLPAEDLFPSDDLFPSPQPPPGATVIRWGLRYYLDNDAVEDHIIDDIGYAEASADHDWADKAGTVTIPEGVNWFRILLQVTGVVDNPEGAVWFENVMVTDHDTTVATVSKPLTTRSTFSKVAVDFMDSGLWRGDSMWADINPDSESINDTDLAYYTRLIPESIEGSTWGDTSKTWNADNATWGSPFGVVNISVDNNRRFGNKRVLRLRRAASGNTSTPEAGIKVKQWTHYVPGGLFRIGAAMYKPLANDNQIKVRLRRLADGVVVYEEMLTPPNGRWYEFQTKFVEIPAGPNQEYEVMFTMDGDDEDEVFLADLYTELALIRYFVRLGNTIGASYLHDITDSRYVSGYRHEVTDLRYVNGRANVSTTIPVNDLVVEATILSPEAFAYGVRVTPSYLK